MIDELERETPEGPGVALEAERRSALRRFLARITLPWRWLLNPDAVGQPITLKPRILRLLALLILGNLIVLALMGLMLHQSTNMPTRVDPVQQPVVVAATPASSPTPGPTPTPLGSGGAIAFTLRQNGNADVYALNQRDQQLVRLTHNPAEDRSPAWSPDGDYIAFASNRADNWDVYLLDLVSGALIRLTHHPGFDANPSWSPDGNWIAFESYRRGSLDVYVMSTTGKQLRPITTDSAPDYAPAWSSDSRAVAFTSLRDGSKDVYLHLLDDQEGPINITNSPDLDEDKPAWSPDGTHLAYVSGPRGSPSVQVTTFDWDALAADQVQTEFFGTGDSPVWAPDGESLVYTYERGGRGHLVAASMTGWALFHDVYSTAGLLGDLAWTDSVLSPRVIDRARVAESTARPPFYAEIVQPTPVEGAPYRPVSLPGVETEEGVPLLSDRVNESFNALRRQIVEEAGWDYLAEVRSLWLPITRTPPSGQSRKSWHLCGRAVALDQGPYESQEPRIELIQEDVGNATYWRVFLRAAEQDGSMGEPLRELPWNLNARQEGGRAEVDGGALRDGVPAGYYVDFTTLAADYGWERVPSLWRWRYFWPDILWWEYRKTDDLTWWDCMLEVFEPVEIEPVFGPVPGQRD